MHPITYTESPSDRLYISAAKLKSLSWMLYCTHEQGDSLKGSFANGIEHLFREEAEAIDAVSRELSAADSAAYKTREAEGSKAERAKKIAADLTAALDTAKTMEWKPGPRLSYNERVLNTIERGVCDAFELAGLDSTLGFASLMQTGRLWRLTNAFHSELKALRTVDPAQAERMLREDAEQAALDHQSAKLDAELAGHAPQFTAEELRQKFIADHLRRGVGSAEIAEALNMNKPQIDAVAAQLLGEDGPAKPKAERPPRGKPASE